VRQDAQGAGGRDARPFRAAVGSPRAMRFLRLRLEQVGVVDADIRALGDVLAGGPSRTQSPEQRGGPRVSCRRGKMGGCGRGTPVPRRKMLSVDQPMVSAQRPRILSGAHPPQGRAISSWLAPSPGRGRFVAVFPRRQTCRLQKGQRSNLHEKFAGTLHAFLPV